MYGDSTDEEQKEFMTNMKALQALPVWVVIRLCTNDKDVINYYNTMDKDLEVSVEVLDDFFGEAREVHKHNPWINYTLPLHRCREMGYHRRMFDLLDERLLSKDELKEYLELLFGSDAMETFPDINVNWKDFLTRLSTLGDMKCEHYNPWYQKPTPWIDLNQLDRCYKNYKPSGMVSSSSSIASNCEKRLRKLGVLFGGKHS